MTKEQFIADIRAGIPETLPEPQIYDTSINHAPKRKDILTAEEKKLALRNALRYFPKKFHATLAPEYITSVCSSVISLKYFITKRYCAQFWNTAPLPPYVINS